MAQGILVFLEVRQGKIKKTSLEALGAARKLADSLHEDVTGILIGMGQPDIPLGEYGADKVLCAKNQKLEAYSTEAYAETIAQAARKLTPRIILGSAGAMGRDLLPRVAARLRVGLAQDCVELQLTADRGLECTRPIYAGKALARVRLEKIPAIVRCSQRRSAN